MFWVREVVGWVLIGLGLFVFGVVCFILLPNGRFTWSVPMTFIGFIIFRGGIHLQKVAVAARICRELAGEAPLKPVRPETHRLTLPEVLDQEWCFRVLWEHFSRPESWRPHPDTGDVLTTLAARGLVLGIASNFDARLKTILAGIPELAPVRPRCVVSSLVGSRKP